LFTDGEVTPTRVETLIDLLRGLSNRKIDREMIGQLLQPEGLPDVEPKKREVARDAIKAAIDLGLIEETEDKLIKLVPARNDPRTSKQLLVEALDKKVLAETTIEPHLARFYSYLLFLNKDGASKKSYSERARDFERDVYGERRAFNDTKIYGLDRWMGYLGLGWYDTNGIFQPNPYERLLRSLRLIFEGRTRRLTIDDFMTRLGLACPELDGGNIFVETNKQYNSTSRTCTLGLSHALVDLHLDKRLKLFCPPDSRGWSIELAEPPSDGLQSGRVATVELLSFN
jgi:hypothetical protein